MKMSPSILVVDDDTEVRLGVADLLGGIGLRVLQAETGMEAIDVVGRNPVDGALLDMHMPGLTGIEAIPLLHRVRRELRCIVYSGRWTRELEDAVLAAGACACLRKPVQPDVLRREVLRALDLPNDSFWSPHLDNN